MKTDGNEKIKDAKKKLAVKDKQQKKADKKEQTKSL